VTASPPPPPRKSSESIKRGWRRRLRKQEGGKYPLEHSPLFKISSIHVLARLLGLTPKALLKVAQAPAYRRFIDNSEAGKKPRNVQTPEGLTLQLHYRVLQLLDRIERPTFLHSATKGRSYVSNAAVHANNHPAVTADISNFFESTARTKVRAFFKESLGMAGDLAKHLAAICTVDDHLATGSPLSPLLSYFAHRPMFLEMERMAQDVDVKMSLYVDDLTFSGAHASEGFLAQAGHRIRQNGLKTNPSKNRSFAGSSVKLITGAAIEGETVTLPNAKRRQIVEDITAEARATGDALPEIQKRVRGRIAAARAVNKAAAKGLELRRQRTQKKK